MYQLEDMRARGSNVFIRNLKICVQRGSNVFINKFRRNEKHENINMLIKTTVA